MEKELSDLKMTRQECKKCGAVWINGQHRWNNNGNVGNELDLAGLVCNRHNSKDCINPCKGKTGGDTWEARLELINGLWEKVQDKIN